MTRYKFGATMGAAIAGIGASLVNEQPVARSGNVQNASIGAREEQRLNVGKTGKIESADRHDWICVGGSFLPFSPGALCMHASHDARA